MKKTRAKPAAPARKPAPADASPAAEQAAAAQALALARPFIANKALEFGRDNAVAPPLGVPSLTITVSSVSSSESSLILKDAVADVKPMGIETRELVPLKSVFLAVP